MNTDTKLTTKQRKRLELFAIDDESEPVIVGWSDRWHGPVMRFATGFEGVITRDGGLQSNDSAYAA